MTDLKQIEAAQQGSKEAMVELLQQYRAIVVKKARLYYLAGGDQEDLIQEGMIALMRAVWDYRPDRGSSFASFAARCVENRIKSVVTAASRLKYSPLNNSVSLYEPVDEDGSGMTLIDQLPEAQEQDPEEVLMQQESVRQIVATARTALSELEKKVLYGYLFGASHKEIARQIGRDEKAVDNALQRIRKKI